MKRLLSFVLIALVATVAFAQGKSKPGKYVERYEIPFSKLRFDKGETYKNGTVRIYVDVEYINALYLEFRDSGGDYIWHEFFCDEIPPEMIYEDVEEKVHMARTDGSTGYSVRSDAYQLNWGNQRFLFYKMKHSDGETDYRIELMFDNNGDNILIRKEQSFTCILDTSYIPSFKRVFNKASQLRAVRLYK